MKFLLILSTVFVFFFSLTACGHNGSTRNITEMAPIDSYPIPSEDLDESEHKVEAAYPVPSQESFVENQELIIPTPSLVYGVAYGRLISLINNEPIQYSKVYFGRKIEVENEDDYLISIQEKLSPHNISTQNGYFVISDITSGEYILVLATPIGSYPITNMLGEQVEVTIKGGDSLDLGDVFVNWPDIE